MDREGFKKNNKNFYYVYIHRIQMLLQTEAETFINVFSQQCWLRDDLKAEFNMYSNISVYVSLTITICNRILTLCFPINKLFFLFSSNFSPLRKFSLTQIMFFPQFIVYHFMIMKVLIIATIYCVLKVLTDVLQNGWYGLSY